ncbi:MAG: cation diffusion facilitator family transporter [Thermoplasmata archaeon]|nr:cation diffusion facilitator family transporter [Thermoplasmata archaeon]
MRAQVIIGATIVLDAILFLVNAEVAYLSSSRAVFSQAVYTLTDLVGGLLLLWGFYASRRPPDHDHPFGHGKERFFWAFTASLITFSVAGIVTLVSGIFQVFTPEPVTHLPAALGVVGATVAVSVVGIAVTLRELRIGQESLSSLLDSAHQGLKTIFYQDLISIFGSLVAFVGIGVVYLTKRFQFDGITAVAVGLLLVSTGFILAAESRELLVGRSIPAAQAKEVLEAVEADPRVRKVRGFQSMMLGPDDVLLALRVNFQDGLTTDEIESVIDQLGTKLRKTIPTVRHIIIEPES